jgi:DNA-binding GntR family transcriptional regulator
MPSEPIRRQTLSAQVAEVIRGRIVDGRYKAGEQLRQEHVASELGVSRIPVREALHQLHSEGFVTLVSHKGAVVSEISIEQIRELFELRARIETWILALALPHMTEPDLALAKQQLDRFDREGTLENWNEINWAFHAALYAPAKRPTTMGLLAKLHQQIERYTRILVSFARDQVKANAEHAAILRLCRDRDTLRAVNLLDAHIMEAGCFLIAQLEGLRGEKAAQTDP